MPSKSKKQSRMMTAVCKSPKFRKKVGISKKVGCDFHNADKGGWHESTENGESEEMTKKVDEKFEFSKDKKHNDDGDVRTLMKMAGIDKKMEDNKEGEIDFDGMFTGVADGEIKVDEDLEKLKSLAGLSEKNVKRSIFSRDQEHDRFSLFKEMEKPEEIDEAPITPLHHIDPPTGAEKNVYKGPWGKGGSNDPMVREPEKAGHEPDSAEIMDKFYEFSNPDMATGPSDAVMKTVDWLKDEFNIPEDPATGLVHQAFEDAGLDMIDAFRADGMSVVNDSVNEFDDYDGEEDMEPTYLHAEPQMNPRELVDTLGHQKGDAVASQLAAIMGYQYEWGRWGGRGNPEPMEEQNSNALSYIVEFLQSKNELEMADEIIDYLQTNESELDEVAPKGWEGTVKKMKKHKEIDNPYALAHWMKKKGYQHHEGVDEDSYGVDVEDHDYKINTAVEMYQEGHTLYEIASILNIEPEEAADLLTNYAGVDADELVWEAFEKQNRKSEMFAEGSYDRMIVELIVEEMKKGKSTDDISETLGFDPDEIFYVVEFFKNKKLKETKVEEKETVTESKEEDITLKRIKFLTEYKN